MSELGYSIERIAREMSKWWATVMFAEKPYGDFGNFYDCPNTLFPQNHRRCTDEEKESFRRALEERIINEYHEKGGLLLETDYKPNLALWECLQTVHYDPEAYYRPTKAMMVFEQGKVRWSGCKFLSRYWHEQKITP